MIEIRLANNNDKENIIDFYKTVSNDLNNKALWHYGLYPADEDLIKDIIIKNYMY